MSVYHNTIAKIDKFLILGCKCFVSLKFHIFHPPYKGVCLAVAHSSVAIGNFGGLLESISMVAHRAIGNKIDNIMVARFLIFCSIKHHSDSPITMVNLLVNQINYTC